MKKISLFLMVLFCFTFSTCNLFAIGPVFNISPDTIQYGTIPIGESAAGNFTISNTGDENGSITFGAISGPGSNYFWWMSGTSLMVAPGATSFVNVPCFPSAPGIINATALIYTSDPQLPVFYLHLVGTAVGAPYTITGTIYYPNPDNIPLAGLMIDLKNEGGTVISTTTSDYNGSYFFQNIPNGNYSLEVSADIPWGGVTALDIMLYQKHIANIAFLSGIFLASGDVNGSGTLTASDVLLIRKRIAAIGNSFPVGDWLFNTQPVTINGSNIIYDFNGICYGDANGSYVPSNLPGF
ncbi:MAG: carboxypeptidase regulatory-like domain-containing protein [Bacteroidales bacterium]|nr:carboxypeptidase regulatory-like domain-containing protein [Bacteroidales bacterium]